MDKEKIKEILANLALIATIGIAVVLCSFFTGCKTVYRDVEVMNRDTLIVKDSVRVTDTITQVRVEREVVEKEIYRDRTQDYRFGIADERGNRVDTVTIYEKVFERSNTDKAVLDSLVRALERYQQRDSAAIKNDSKIEKKVIEKPLTMQQKFLMLLGEVFIFLVVALGIGYATYIAIRKSKDMKSLDS